MHIGEEVAFMAQHYSKTANYFGGHVYRTGISSIKLTVLSRGQLVVTLAKPFLIELLCNVGRTFLSMIK